MQQMWADAEKEELIATWREYLTPFSGEDIRDALSACPGAYVDYPPTLPQFVNLCKDARRVRAATTPRLTPPVPVMSPEQMAAVKATVATLAKPERDGKGWARKIMARKAAGEHLPWISVEYAQEVLA